MPQVANFLPSVNGLPFTNSWPDEPDIDVTVPGVGNVALGSASNGLCGGMVFTVMDVFNAGRPPISAAQPPQGSPLFNYIVRRLIDSWNAPMGVLKYYDWMLEPDGDLNLWLATRRGVSYRTIVEEWPMIQATIDGGSLCPLGLVTVRSTSPNDLGKNHQVLAYGYDLNGTSLTIHVGDPNTPRAAADGVTIALDLAQPTHATPITHNVNIGHPIRGFFNVPYRQRMPPGA